MSTSRIATLPLGGDETLRLNYLSTPPSSPSSQKGTIVLLHGFPQTSHQFRHVISPFAAAGYRVLAPDYRGAGASSRPLTGYTKSQMASDIHALVQHLGITTKLWILGHDIGGMIAHTYAARYPNEVAGVVWGECPLPGTAFFDESYGSSQEFHFVFHQVLDLPEALIAGREEVYLRHFFEKLSYNSGGIGRADLAVYAEAYRQPGAMRAGLSLYRAFGEDTRENRERVQREGKCRVRCLVLNGEMGHLARGAEGMAGEMYEGAEVAFVPEAGHYVAEENPEGFVEAVLKFLEG